MSIQSIYAKVLEALAASKTVTVVGEAVGNGSGTQTYSGSLDNGDVVAKTATIQCTAVISASDVLINLTDVNGDGNLVGNNAVVGTIDYTTGAITIDAGATNTVKNTAIVAEYAYTVDETQLVAVTSVMGRFTRILTVEDKVASTTHYIKFQEVDSPENQ